MFRMTRHCCNRVFDFLAFILVLLSLRREIADGTFYDLVGLGGKPYVEGDDNVEYDDDGDDAMEDDAQWERDHD